MAFSPISKSSLHFNTHEYTGNAGTNNVTGVGFQPDIVWLKGRAIDDHHTFFDAVRGATKRIFTNLNQQDSTQSDSLTAFGADGFTLGADGLANANNGGFVSWNWKAGGGAGSSNTDGSINTTSTSVNTTAKISISKYTGTGSNATVGHGLGVVPKLVIVKKLSGADDWKVYHVSKGAALTLVLHGTNAATSDTTSFNSTVPTSSVFSVGTSSATNTSGQTYIAYCFGEVSGFSKFGKYQGTGSADGAFLFTGFKPGFIIFKDTEGSGNYDKGWHIYDSKRIGYNPKNYTLNTEASAGEVTTDRVDLLSNGFKLRTTTDGFNQSNNNYLYIAFAENPFISSKGVPTTAR